MTQYLRYDGLGRLTRKAVTTNSIGNGVSEDSYYDQSDQVIDLRADTVASGDVMPNAVPRERDLSDKSYVNSPAMTELDDNADGVRDRRLYPIWNANFDISGLAAPHGRAVKQFY